MNANTETQIDYCDECTFCIPHQKMEFAQCRIRERPQNIDNIKLTRVSRRYKRETSAVYEYCELIRTGDKCGGFRRIET